MTQSTQAFSRSQQPNRSKSCSSPFTLPLSLDCKARVIPTLSDVSYRKATVEDFPGILGLIRGSVYGVFREHGFFDSSPFASPKFPPFSKQGFSWLLMGL